jgi:hypothetical protein
VKILRTNLLLDTYFKAQKNEDLQRILYHTKSFILSNYNSLYLTANKSLIVKCVLVLFFLRLELQTLRVQGDMTRRLLMLAAEIKITPELLRSFMDGES